ncbi:MAG: biotin/lipoyl-containing protein [Magnetospirillum sp.]
MQRKLRITVEGKVYDVLVEELSENGHVAPSYPSIAGTGAPSHVAAAPIAAPPPPAAAPKPVAGAGDEISPLAGVVESLAVSLGQSVCAGDKIMVIEAMKMKTPIHANHSGTVKTITVVVGQAVEAGAVLMTIG